MANGRYLDVDGYDCESLIAQNTSIRPNDKRFDRNNYNGLFHFHGTIDKWPSLLHTSHRRSRAQQSYGRRH